MALKKQVTTHRENKGQPKLSNFISTDHMNPKGSSYTTATCSVPDYNPSPVLVSNLSLMKKTPLSECVCVCDHSDMNTHIHTCTCSKTQ